MRGSAGVDITFPSCSWDQMENFIKQEGDEYTGITDSNGGRDAENLQRSSASQPLFYLDTTGMNLKEREQAMCLNLSEPQLVSDSVPNTIERSSGSIPPTTTAESGKSIHENGETVKMPDENKKAEKKRRKKEKLASISANEFNSTQASKQEGNEYTVVTGSNGGRDTENLQRFSASQPSFYLDTTGMNLKEREQAMSLNLSESQLVSDSVPNTIDRSSDSIPPTTIAESGKFVHENGETVKMPDENKKAEKKRRKKEKLASIAANEFNSTQEGKQEGNEYTVITGSNGGRDTENLQRFSASQPSFYLGTTGMNLKEREEAMSLNLSESQPVLDSVPNTVARSLGSILPTTTAKSGRSVHENGETVKMTDENQKTAKKRRKKEKLVGITANEFSSPQTKKRQKCSQEILPVEENSSKNQQWISCAQNSIVKYPANQGCLTRKQRMNPLTMIVMHMKYPEGRLSRKQLELFRGAVRLEVDKTPLGQWPKFDDSLYREGIFVIISSDLHAKNWLIEHMPNLKLWEGAELKLGGVELLQKLVKAAARFPGENEDCNEILRRLERYNPELKTSTWHLLPYGSKDKMFPGTTLLNISMPETQAKVIEELNYKPYYDLGRVIFRLMDNM